MKNRIIYGMAVFSFVILSLSSAYALTADEIVKKANEAAYYQADDGKAEVRMEITDSLGRVREREMTILRIDSQNSAEQKYFVYFHKPNDVSGMTYLVWKHVGSDDDRWLYLPALDLVRRVASSDKRSSFVGSHFVYEDISGRGIEEDEHELLGEEDGFYKIKSVPKDKGGVEFSYYISWIDKKNFIPKKAEYYDKNGKKYRVIEALEVEEVQGFPTITKMMVSDLNSGGHSVTEFESIEYNVGLKDNIFTERFLRKPPRQYIK